MGEGDTLVVVTVAALAFGLLRLIFSSFVSISNFNQQ
jgi:hypothetical protein